MYIKSFPFRAHGGPKRVYNVYNERDEYLVTFRLLREAKDFIKINQGIPSITVAAGLARNLGVLTEQWNAEKIPGVWTWNGEKRPWNREKETWGSQWNAEKNSGIQNETIFKPVTLPDFQNELLFA